MDWWVWALLIAVAVGWLVWRNTGSRKKGTGWHDHREHPPPGWRDPPGGGGH
jgi:hypothetical protein